MGLTKRVQSTGQRWRSRYHASAATASLLLFLAASSTVFGENWARFRGPNGSGVSETSRPLPESLDPLGAAWRVPVPEGVSSPVVAGEHVYLTAHEEGTLIVLCYRASTGELLWRKELVRERTDVHLAPNGPASPTPVTDGENLYVLFAEAALASYGPAGQERWRLPMEPFHVLHGFSASLVLAEGKLFVLADQARDAFLAAYDAETGLLLWKTKRPDSPFGGYTTPVLRDRSDGTTELVVSAALELAGYSTETGEKLWSLGGLNPQPKTSPIIEGTAVYVNSASVGTTPLWNKLFAYYATQDENHDGKISVSELEGDEKELFLTVEANLDNGDGEADLTDGPKWLERHDETNGLSAVRIDGGEPEPSVQWRMTKLLPEVATPILYRGLLYVVKNGGILTAIDPETGVVKKRGRIPDAIDNYYASPVASDGKLFLLSVSGQASVVEAGAEWTVLSVHSFGEDCYATPAIADGRIYLRTSHALYSFVKGVERMTEPEGEER